MVAPTLSKPRPLVVVLAIVSGVLAVPKSIVLVKTRPSTGIGIGVGLGLGLGVGLGVGFGVGLGLGDRLGLDVGLGLGARRGGGGGATLPLNHGLLATSRYAAIDDDDVSVHQVKSRSLSK